MTFFLAILGFVFGLGAIVLIHEFGHFIFAKRAGILCYEFSIGMGPAIFKKKVGETTYAIRAIPLGGFVSMAGEEIDSNLIRPDQEIGLTLNSSGLVEKIALCPDDSYEIRGFCKNSDLYGEEGELFIEIEDGESSITYTVLRDASYVMDDGSLLQIAPYERCFESKSLLDRFLSIFAGPFMNFVLAFIIFFIVALCQGEPTYTKTQIGEISGAATDILLVGDEITHINGIPVSTWDELSSTLDNNIGEEVITFSLIRDGNPITKDVYPDIFIANLGFYGSTKDVTSNGVKVSAYTIKADEAGLQSGDIVQKIDDVNISSWNDLIEIANKHKDGDIITVDVLRVDKDGTSSKHTLTITTLEDKVLDASGIKKVRMQIGISPTTHFSLGYSLKSGFVSIGDNVVSIFETLGLLFTSKQVGIKNLSGPVGIFTLIMSTITGGFLTYISFVGFLSVNVGLINLLPIPALDGGRLVFLLYELITRKKPNKKFENTLNMVVFILLMIFFVYITFNDIMRLF